MQDSVHTPGREEIDELVRRAQKGEETAFAALYDHFYGRIFRYVSFKIGNAGEAEDITEDVFLRMLESIQTFKWRGHPFSAWLFRVAHNLVVDHFRKKGRERVIPLDTVIGTAGSSSADLDRYVEIKLAMQEVHGAMGGLTDLQREVISLRFAGGLSVLETARAVGKKENAVKALQHAGIRKLRRLLTPEQRASTQPAVP